MSRMCGIMKAINKENIESKRNYFKESKIKCVCYLL